MTQPSYKVPSSNITKLDFALAYYNRQKVKNLKHIVYTKIFRPKGLTYENGIAKLMFEGKEIRFKPHYLLEGYLLETFYYQELKTLDVKDKIVFDVGAAVGDTAMYFLAKGAKHVYSYEPDDEMYEATMETVRLNKVEDKVTVVKRFVGDGTDNTLKFSDAIPPELGDDLVLKMDIEGGEYPSIFSTDCKTLNRFTSMAMEYHKGYLDLRDYIANCGFKVKVYRPNRGRVFNNDVFSGLMFIERASK